MSRSKHTEAQMIAAVKQMEAGRKAEDVAREVGLSAHTIYAWKAKYGGMDVSEAKEGKRLRDENSRLRKLVADLSLDKEALQSMIEKKRMELTAMKAAVEQIRTKFAFTERRACKLLLIAVSSYRYKPWQQRRGGWADFDTESQYVPSSQPVGPFGLKGWWRMLARPQDTFQSFARL